tara:strand:- start:1951 stop:2298 length:348 start_codon:yes stop_codon:yes gene_type:complete
MDDVISTHIFEQCSRHASKSPGRESCGIVLNFTPKVFFPMQNRIANERAFELSPKIHLIKKKIFCIFHSHPLASAFPSDSDISYSKALGIPFLIYSMLYDNFIYFDLKKCIPLKA